MQALVGRAVAAQGSELIRFFDKCALAWRQLIRPSQLIVQRLIGKHLTGRKRH